MTGITKIGTYVVGYDPFAYADFHPRERIPPWIFSHKKIGKSKIVIPGRSDGFNGSCNHVSALFSRRLRQLQTGSPYPLEIQHAFVGYGYGTGERLESYLHGHFASRKIKGEWFAFDLGDTEAEWFESQVGVLYSALNAYMRETGEQITWAGSLNSEVDKIWGQKDRSWGIGYFL